VESQSSSHDATLEPEKVWLVGFRLNPDRDLDEQGPEFYCLLLERRDEGPVSSEGYTIFFKDINSAGTALRMDDDETVGELTPPTDVDYICDVADLLYLITSEDEKVDEEKVFLNCLNVAFDLVKSAGLPLPEDYKRVLYPLADYMTFDRDFDQFLRKSNVARSQVHDGILWMMGAVVSRCKVIH
jgi:hypothetical protein